MVGLSAADRIGYSHGGSVLDLQALSARFPTLPALLQRLSPAQLLQNIEHPSEPLVAFFTLEVLTHALRHDGAVDDVAYAAQVQQLCTPELCAALCAVAKGGSPYLITRKECCSVIAMLLMDHPSCAPLWLRSGLCASLQGCLALATKARYLEEFLDAADGLTDTAVFQWEVIGCGKDPVPAHVRAYAPRYAACCREAVVLVLERLACAATLVRCRAAALAADGAALAPMLLEFVGYHMDTETGEDYPVDPAFPCADNALNACKAVAMLVAPACEVGEDGCPDVADVCAAKTALLGAGVAEKVARFLHLLANEDQTAFFGQFHPTELAAFV